MAKFLDLDIKTMSLDRWRALHPKAEPMFCTDVAGPSFVSALKCPETGEIYILDVAVKSNEWEEKMAKVPRVTKDVLIKRNGILNQRISDLENEIESIKKKSQDDVASCKKYEEGIRSVLTSILCLNRHSESVERSIFEGRRRVPQTLDYSGRGYLLSWEEIFFMIGGLHATSEYSERCRQIERLQAEIDRLKSPGTKTENKDLD